MPVVWNDLIREVERIRRRKNQSPLSASWHRNVGIALKHCPFELAEATPEAIREWIDQMQDSGLSGLTINSKCSLLSSLVSKCMHLETSDESSEHLLLMVRPLSPESCI